jgi:sulfite reductase alpha subunit
VGLPIDPNMIVEPRANPYVRTDDWDEQVAKWEEQKAAAG